MLNMIMQQHIPTTKAVPVLVLVMSLPVCQTGLGQHLFFDPYSLRLWFCYVHGFFLIDTF